MKTIFLFVLCFVAFASSAKILGILHVPSNSHYIIGKTIFQELADKGHDVTIASIFKSKEKNINYREIFIDGLIEVLEGARPRFFTVVRSDIITVLREFAGYTNALANTTLRSPGIQNLLKSGEKFDVLIVEPFGNEAFFGLAHAFNSHVVVLSTASSMWVNHYTGNVAPYSFVPHLMTSFSDNMTFYQRFINSVVYLCFQMFNNFWVWPVQKELYEEFFENVPPFEDTLKNVSLALVNSHVVFETPRPYLPNMIPIIGAHIKEPKKLPQDLQTFLDDAKEGVIYFSLGSNLQSTHLPVEKQQAILDTFSKLPQKILWKFEDENLPNKPSNVKLGKWFPQSDILAHPNVKLFISHCGFLSTVETVFRGVPVVGVPIYGDQFSHSARMVKYGFGQSVLLDEMTEETFTKAIKEVLDNPSYAKSIKKAAALLADQPDTPLNRAIFWVEHIIKHNGGAHLRCASLDVPLYQYFLLDILGVVLIAFSIILALFYGIFKICCRRTKNVDSKKIKPKRE